MPNVIVVGTQWGDEGKGKIIDLLTPSVDLVVRFQGGANAGHTVIIGDEKTILHLVPSGILHDKCLCIIGNGVVVDPRVLIDEIEGLFEQGYLKDSSRLSLSQNAHLVMPYHKVIDALREESLGSAKIGTTGRGIGPCYEDKVARMGIRAGDLKNVDAFRQSLEKILPVKNEQIKLLGGKPLDIETLMTEAETWCHRLGPHVIDSEKKIHEYIRQGKRILLEGAQGTALDVDHGTYPFVTSSNTVAGSACAGAGVGPTAIDEVLGITKAYTTRVGNGPFPTELFDETGESLQNKGKEFGATTGRRRRCGWFDAVLVNHASRVNGLTMLAVTKLDVLSGLPKVKICTGYRLGDLVTRDFPSSMEMFSELKPVYEEMPGWNEDISKVTNFEALPENARNYLHRISQLIGVPISILSVGPERHANIILKNPF